MCLDFSVTVALVGMLWSCGACEDWDLEFFSSSSFFWL